MAQGITNVTNWLLKQSPRTVKRLEREREFVKVGDSEKLGIKGISLLVPEGIVVYRAICDFRNETEAFFTAREKSDTAHAYLSWISREDCPLNIEDNIGELLKYPWYNNEDSSRIFARLCTHYTKKNFHITNAIRQTKPHPFFER